MLGVSRSDMNDRVKMWIPAFAGTTSEENS
jgi:hypothetical protein